jgi:hypothetical protein
MSLLKTSRIQKMTVESTLELLNRMTVHRGMVSVGKATARNETHKWERRLDEPQRRFEKIGEFQTAQ